METKKTGPVHFGRRYGRLIRFSIGNDRMPKEVNRAYGYEECLR